MPIYDVTAIVVDRRTGDVVTAPRVERIDTDDNELFAECNDELEVHREYEEFWEALKDCCPCGCANQMVRVLTVTRVV